MFIINGNASEKFNKIMAKHLYLNAKSDVYYQNARMLNKSQKYLDYESFEKYYKNILADIELKTEPIDAFMPPVADEGEEIKDDEVRNGMFIVTRVGEEYEKIDKRVTWEDMEKTLPPTHPAIIAIKEDMNNFQVVKDDIYISWSLYKYLKQLDEIRLLVLSNATPMIDYVAQNVDSKVIKNFMHTTKVNTDKANKIIKEIFFKPDFDFTCAFYDVDHSQLPSFDLELVMQKLLSNIDCTVDKAVIVAIYLIATFAITDIKNNHFDNDCVKYVLNVISKI